MPARREKSLGRPERLAATLNLDASVARVPGVSSARTSALAKMGIATVRDLLAHYPRRYLDMSHVVTVADAPIGALVTVSGTVHEVKLKKPRPRLTLTEITVVDATGVLVVTCFRQPWLADRLHAGDALAVAGKVEFNYGFKRMTNPFLEPLEEGASAVGMVVPVHPATERMPTAQIRRLISAALDLCEGMYDPLPLELRMKYRLPSRQAAMRAVHEPHHMEDVQAARRRLAYEELLMLELHLLMRSRNAAQDAQATAHRTDGPHLARFREALPFELTEEQQRAVRELLQGMAQQHCMKHMLLGDVGTGKTVVAAHALCAVADTGTQAFMMAPTEVLARQYEKSLGPLLDQAGVTWETVTGSTPAREREAVLERAAAGTVDVLFGTQALLEDDVRTPCCSLVVIDEQQRFGVAQREALVRKGVAPDVLTMTATPIPRSLALAIYGDSTLSYLTVRPRNRAGNTTRVLDRSSQGVAYDAACEALREGRQVYVVCPLVGSPADGKEDEEPSGRAYGEEAYEYGVIVIEDGEMPDEDLKAASAQARFLQAKVFPDFKVGLLHGKMSGEEKREVMERFRAGDVRVLVATTVIEVGVDVPNATVMIVEDAERFGLAQLHQLRGRVGRGDHPGSVFLVSGSRAPAALERLAVMERTEDGFAVAESDLALRREGDILGNRQHGASTLKLVNVVRDRAIVEAAHADALDMLAEDPEMDMPAHRALAREVRMLFARCEDKKE